MNNIVASTPKTNHMQLRPVKTGSSAMDLYEYHCRHLENSKDDDSVHLHF